jgi:hypothetical protein
MQWYLLSRSPHGGIKRVGPYSEAAVLDALSSARLRPGTILIREDGAQFAVKPPVRKKTSVVRDVVSLVALAAGTAVAVTAADRLIEYLSSTQEQRSIRRSARRHERRGAIVLADHVGWDAVPPITGRRRADVMALYRDRVVIEEHETSASARRTHSREQDRDLRAWSRRNGARYRQVISE